MQKIKTRALIRFTSDTQRKIKNNAKSREKQEIVRKIETRALDDFSRTPQRNIGNNMKNREKNFG